MGLLRLLLFLAIAALHGALPATAQDTGADEGKSSLERLIEGALSDGARQVTISGFSGALSSHATLARLTIADQAGVWLTLEDAALTWSRAALLQGRLEIAALTAGSVTLTRLPERAARLSPKDAEARPFALPALPVSVSIGTIRADRLRLGPAILGEAVTLSARGGLRLDAGEAEAALELRRIGRDDRLTLDAGYSDATGILRLNLDFTEAPDGLVSRLLRVPNRPALRLGLTGAAPLADYRARLDLASDGQRRLGGTVRIKAAGSDGTAGYAFSAALKGDLRPLFIAELHPFFGARASLDLAGQTGGDGGLRIDRLALDTAAMTLTGDLALAADGWPWRVRLEGRIAGNTPLRLPLPGPATDIKEADFSLRHDAAAGAAWLSHVTLTGLARDGLRVARARLDGSGTITNDGAPEVTADIRLRASGIGDDDPALARALGGAVAGQAALRWQEGAPLRIERLEVSSGDVSLRAEGRVDGLARGFPVTGSAILESADLGRFAALAGRDLGGGARATLAGSGALLGGAFDIRLAARTSDLRTGAARLDALLAGQTRLAMTARRDATGTTLEGLSVRNAALTANAEGRLDSRFGTLTLDATVADLARAEPRLSGPARLRSRIEWRDGGTLRISRLHAEGAGAVLDAQGALTPDDPALPASGQLSLSVSDLARLADLAGRPLSGQLALTATGSGSLRGRRIDAEISLHGRDLQSGLARLDPLIAGQVGLNADLAYGEGAARVRRLDLRTPVLTVSAEGTAPGAPLGVSAHLADLALVAPGVRGPVQLEGTLSLPTDGTNATGVDLEFTGPGKAAARIKGQVQGAAERLSLDIGGQAPLALVNGIIAPRALAGQARFALRLDGRPQPAALSGRVTLDDARLALPRLRSALSRISGTITLGSGQAGVDLGGRSEAGGRFRLRGPVGLSPPFDAGLNVTLDAFGLSDPRLFETTASGFVRVSGPLAGGARIAGTLELGRTELRMPSGSGAALASIPPITHLGETPAQRRTRQRAGLIERPKDTAGPGFALDLTIIAPGRIFVRGRGLDAELGGNLRLTGSTADVRPAGSFSLLRGRLDLLDRRLELSEGSVDLRGSLDPWLRFVASSETDDMTANIVLEGPASAPELRLTSTPELPQEEILAQLLFGHSLSSISPFQAARLVSAAATLSGRAGGGSGGLMGRLRDSLGLSNFDVTTTPGGATELSAGAYLSDKLYSEITADSEGRQQIDLKLDLSRSLTVKGRASTTGETGIGLFFEKDY